MKFNANSVYREKYLNHKTQIEKNDTQKKLNLNNSKLG